MRYLEEPAKMLTDPRELLLGYVEAYRNAMRRKVADAESELYARRLPSGWTPLELLKHLAYHPPSAGSSATSCRSTPVIWPP
jgi:hypothetical protein